MKVVVNRCYGSFGLSHEAVMRYSELAGLNLVGVQDSLFYHYYRDGKIGDEDYYWSEGDLERTDPLLIQVVEELGENPKEYKIYDLTPDIIMAVASVVENKIDVFGSANKI